MQLFPIFCSPLLLISKCQPKTNINKGCLLVWMGKLIIFWFMTFRQYRSHFLSSKIVKSSKQKRPLKHTDPDARNPKGGTERHLRKCWALRMFLQKPWEIEQNDKRSNNYISHSYKTSGCFSWTNFLNLTSWTFPSLRSFPPSDTTAVSALVILLEFLRVA